MKTDSFCVELSHAEFHRDAINVSATFDVALHSTEPDSDTQSSGEVGLSGYSRVAVMRDADSWIVTGRTITNGKLIKFGTITRGKDTARWLTLGIDGVIRRVLKLKTPVELAVNRRVEFEPGAIEITEDK